MTLVLAMVMMLGMGMNVFAGDDDDVTPAATPTNQSPISVTGLAEDDVAHFYHIIEWVGDAEQPAGSVVVSGWKVVDVYKNVLTEAEFKKAFVGTPAEGEEGTEGYVAAVAPTGITADLAGKLARVASKTELTPAVTVGADGKAEKAGIDAGMYMVLVTPKDPDTVYNPIFVSSQYNDPDKVANATWGVTTAATYGDEAAAKKSTVTLSKTATSANEDDLWREDITGTTALTGTESTDLSWTTTAPGDVLTFTVKTTIPGFGTVYENPVFNVKDTLTALTLEKKTDSTDYDVTVTGVDATYNDGEEDKASYTISATDGGYTITFDPGFLQTVIIPTEITITYKAKVAADAPKNVNLEKNEVSTEFSNNPENEDSKGYKKDTTNHYTFSLDANIFGGGEDLEGKKTSELVKTGVDANGEPITKTEVVSSEITKSEKWTSPLAGAKFALFTDASKSAEADAILVATTTGDGRMEFDGLDSGTYYLKELSAPDGFVRDTRTFKVVIDATVAVENVTEYTKDGQEWKSESEYNALTDQTGYSSYTYDTDILKSYTVTVGDNANFDATKKTDTWTFTNDANEVEPVWTDGGVVEHPFEIQNTKGVELPSTGGIGTTIFYILGSILVIASGVALVTKRRMNAE